MSDKTECHEGQTIEDCLTDQPDDKLEDLCVDSAKSKFELNESFFANLKSTVKDLMGSIKKDSLFKNTNTPTESTNGTDVANAETSTSADATPTSGSADELDEKTDESINSIFSMFEKMMKDMNKYPDKPYMATGLMSKYFEGLSKLGDVSSSSTDTDATATATTTDTADVDQEYLATIKAVGAPAKRICEMLENASIEELCPHPEFKECLLQVTINYNKMLIHTFKVGIQKLEERQTQLTNEVPVETLLDDIYKVMSKSKK